MSRFQEGVVGRRSELEVVEGFLAHPRPEAAAVTICGPAGIGKTTVWSAGVERARSLGWRVLMSRPTGAEASLSFAGLLDLFAPVDDAFLRKLPAPQRRALAAALLREEGQPGDPVDALAVAAATHAVLRELAADRPTVVAVDDAQWLDEPTASALRFALRRLDDSPVCVLSSVRVEDGRPETFESVLPDDRRDTLVLAPLSVAALHEIIRARLGRALRRPTLVKIVERSAGNAFYAIEIARELVRSDGADDALPVPASVQELVRARVARLPRDTREALLLASALAAPTTAAVPAQDLLAAEEDGLVRVEGDGRVRFEHPLLAAAIYEAASPAARRRAHRLLAERAEQREERARHLALAAEGPDELVAAELDESATHTAARGASGAAAELARYALELTPAGESEARALRTLALAHHLADAGESAAARAALESCDPESVEGDLRARLLRELGMVHWYEGDMDAGYRLVCEALEQVRDPELAARTHAAAAWLQTGDPPRAIAHADAAVALLDPETSPGPYSWALLHGAYLRLLNGEGADDEAYRRGCELQQRVVYWDDTSPVVGMWPVLKDDFETARRVYESGLARSRDEGDVPSVQGSLLRLAELACWQGDWDAADRFATEGVELADRTSTSAFLGSALYARALVDAHLGRVVEARAAGERIVDAFGATVQGALGHWVLGFVALSLGEAARADESYSRAQRIVDGLGQREPARFRFQPDHLEAVVELGELERARGMLASLDARAEAFPRPWILATGARCRALLLAAQGDLPAALVSAEQAVEHHRDLEMPFERARTLLVEGRILRRLKQKRRAREALDEAVAVFASLGAALWTAVAQEELGRVATRRAPTTLTPTERRIADLAAAGLSNPEIAAQAFVSRKTVEANLARAYRKLGISSRAQLGRALDAERGAIS